MSKGKELAPKFIIFDGKYRFDEDRATIMCCADTLKEAKSDVEDYGDAVVVDGLTGDIVYDPILRDGK